MDNTINDFWTATKYVKQFYDIYKETEFLTTFKIEEPKGDITELRTFIFKTIDEIHNDAKFNYKKNSSSYYVKAILL